MRIFKIYIARGSWLTLRQMVLLNRNCFPFIVGFIWGINSFDQFGVELGKHLAKHVRSQLSASRKTGASVQGFNSSTSSLLDLYLKQQQY